MKALSLIQNKKTFIFLATGILCFAFLYIYFIQQAVHNVVERERLSNEVNLLHSTLSKLESEQVALRGQVNLPTAYLLGFRQVSVAQFIERKAFSAVSLNTLQ